MKYTQLTQSLSTFMFDKSHFITKRPVPNSELMSGGNILADDKIEYVWSRDPSHLRQYMKIIDKHFDDELEITDAYKKIDFKDLNSHFYIFLNQDKVVGGTRFSVCDGFYDYSLPNEKLGQFKYKDIFNNLDLEHCSYAEITRYAVLPKYRNDIRHYTISFKKFKEMCIRLKVKYLFICSTESRARLYNLGARKNFNVLEGRHVKTEAWKELSHFDVFVSVYENTDV